MGIEHHLLGFAGIGTDKRHAAMTEPDMSNLHDSRHAGEFDDFVTPVELVGLPRRKRERYVSLGDFGAPASLPAPCIAPHGIIAASITKLAKVLPHPDQCHALTSRPALVLLQKAPETGNV